MQRRSSGAGRPDRKAWPAVAAAVAAAALLTACGSSSPDVVRAPTPSTSASSSSSSVVPPSSPASSTSASTRTPTVQITPRTRLRSGQLVVVRASGFSPSEPLTVVQCAQKGNSTGPGDCNLTGMLGVTTDARGSVQAQLHVTRGPFGANKIVCSTKQACLISVTQASLSPTEEADQLISFAP